MRKSNEIPDTDDKIIEEIKRLSQSQYVKLAKKFQNKALKQRLYQLRSLEKQGRAIAEMLSKEGDDLSQTEECSQKI